MLEQDGADESGNRRLVGEDADDLGAALDLAVQPLDRISAVQLGAMFLREGHVGQDIGFGGIHEAAKRTGQIAYDLNFHGPAILFSWPSDARIAAYPSDLNNADCAVPHLAAVLEMLIETTGATTLHLIAHSMGNRVLVNALAWLAPRLAARPLSVFSEIFLTAPDIDAEVFRDLAARIAGVGRRMTLYASQNDQALALSRDLNGHPRAGDTRYGVVIVDGVETVDVSAVDSSLVGHACYGSNGTVLADLFEAIRGLQPMSRRVSESRFWRQSHWAAQSRGLQIAVGGSRRQLPFIRSDFITPSHCFGQY